MSFSFIFGPSGSGKTYRAFRDITEKAVSEPDRHFIVIVPEQYGILMQRELLEIHPAHAASNIEVLSFNRLAWRVFEELSIHNPEVLDDTGKAMILRSVASEKASELSVWKDRFKKAGFTEQVKSMIAEFCQYGIRPEDLEKAKEAELKLPLRQKLSDLSVIYRGYRERISNEYLPNEELLAVFSGVVEKSRFLKDAEFLFDGFTGFTPIQYRVVESLMTMGSHVRFTVTIGSEADPYHRLREDALFCMSTDMTAKIVDLAAKNGVSKEEDLVLSGGIRFGRAEDLQFLERHFLRYDGASFPDKPEHIFCEIRKDPKDEAAGAAAHILRLVKEEGYRYKDIAVLCADFAAEAPLLRREFELHGIPYYSDEKLDLSSNPLTELIRSALYCVSNGFSDRGFLRFLKCGLFPEARDDIFLLERYMKLAGVRSFKRLSMPFEYVPREMEGLDLTALNAFREQMLGLLLPLKELFEGGSAKVPDAAQVLRKLVSSTNAEEKLLAMAEEFDRSNDAARSREFKNAAEKVEKLFQTAETLLKDESLKRDEMQSLFEAGLSEIRVGQIPAFADRVSICDLTRSRLNKIRALILLGANDGVLPAVRTSGCILTDQEKECLKGIDITLAPTAREDLYTQRYYLYRMLTSASDRLYLSASAADMSGRSLRPSGIITHLKQVFPLLSADSEKAAERIYSGAEETRRIAGELRAARKSMKIETEGALPLPLLLSGKKGDKTAEMLIRAALSFYEPEGIGRRAAEALYGLVFSGGVTRIEDYYRCPCLHFLKYGLKLKEDREFEVDARDLGTLLHAAVERVFRLAEERKLSLSELTEEERKALADEAADEAIAEEESGRFRDTARSLWIAEKLKRITSRSLAAMTEQLKRGSFVPFAMERVFDAERGMKAMHEKLPGGGEVRLRGKIDRIDICRDGDTVYYKIIDYKSGSTVWNADKAAEGLELQLLVYLNAAGELLSLFYRGKKIVPAAAFYEPLTAGMLERSLKKEPDKLRKEELKNFRPSGLINGADDAFQKLSKNTEGVQEILPVRYTSKMGLNMTDNIVDAAGFERLKKHAGRMIARAGEEILDGSTAVYPYDEGKTNACAGCIYSAVCGFDGKTDGYLFRKKNKNAGEEMLHGMDS